MTSNSYPQKEGSLLIVSLFIFELSLSVMAATLYVKGEKSFALVFSNNPGMVFILALALPALVISGAVIVREYRASRRFPSSHFRLVVMMNLVAVVLIVTTGEMIIRAVSRNDRDREVFGNVMLKPRNWERTKLHYRQLLEKKSPDSSLLVYDDRVGWAVGRNRDSSLNGEGHYWSSFEGARAPYKGSVFPKVETKTEIALVGDSFTFGEEVGYEETWGYRLEQILGEKFQVINFGVPAYGLDQAYLRYEKEVRPRKPKVVILSFINGDLSRTMKVYPFLSTEWNLPFSKPRFVLQDGILTIANMSPLPPEAIFSQGLISDLPFLEHERGDRLNDWQQRWYHVSYLVRFFVSLLPSWSPISSERSEQILSVNAAILKKFVLSVKETGAIPLVVWLPGKEDFKETGSRLSLGKQVLEEAGLAYINPTSCLLEVLPSDRFAPKNHYSRHGNVAVAKCLADEIREALRNSVGDR